MATKPPPLSTVLRTARLELRPPRVEDVGPLRALLRRNEEHLRPWSPLPGAGESPTSLVSVAKRVADERRRWRGDDSFAFLSFLITPLGDFHERKLIGRVVLNRVCRGPFDNAYLGYFVDQEYQGTGLTTEAVAAVTAFALGPAALHRVQAAVIPRNAGSRRVLVKAGYREEGLAQRYLRIAGVWEDHVLYARTAEDTG